MDGMFFALSKILWGMVAPETLLILIFLAGFCAMVARAQRLAISLIGGGLFLMVAIALLPIGNLLLTPLEGRYPAGPPLGDVKGIIVLGGGASPEMAAHWGYPSINDSGDRYIAGADLARRFPAARIFFTGGSGRLFGKRISEASIAREIFRAAGVNPARLIVEGKSQTTAENARLLRKRVSARSDGSWVLITSAFHMPRAMLTFCSAGWDALIAYPTDYRTMGFVEGISWRFADNLANINTGAKEWLGLAAYQLTGRASRTCRT